MKDSTTDTAIINQGFTLIEVLVTLFVLAIGLLTIAGLSITSLRNAQNAYFQSIASIQTSSFLDRLQINRTLESRQRELMLWNAVNKKLLPEGEGSYRCQADDCSVILQWHYFGNHEFSINNIVL